jgi:hypothetical protein
LKVGSTGISIERGPGSFLKGIHEILNYNKINVYYFSSKVYPLKLNKKSKYYYIPFPLFDENVYNKWVNIKEANN